MLFTDKRIVLFVGGYGSGKTEVAVNYTISSKPQHNQLAIVDLDVVNPYFRSRERIELLTSMQIDVVAPAGGLATADLPALPPAITGYLHDPSRQMVFDVGGDSVGARALGRYSAKISADDYELWFVVNASRPFSKELHPTVELLRSIEQTSRLKVTGIINNTNLMQYTDVSLLKKGEELAVCVGKEIGVPVVFNAVHERLAAEAVDLVHHPVFPLHLYMNRPWE